MEDILEVIDLHVPGGPGEALTLALCLLLTFEAGRRLGGVRFGALLTFASASGFYFIGHAAIPITVTIAAWAAVARRPRPVVSPSAFLVEVFFIGGGLLLYQAGRISTRADWDPARANGLRILDFERGLHLYPEPDIQDGLMSNHWVMSAFNSFYSYGFLAIVSAVLVYLFATDRANYRVMRNALGISAILAVITIGLHPTAPPRLLSEAGLLDTVVVEGREHNFTNEYAAIPSLHVGWTVLAGIMLARSIRGWFGLFVAIIPGAAMAITVMATGNHFWVDAAVGVLYSLAPVLLIAHLRRSKLPNMSVPWFRSRDVRERFSLALSLTQARIAILSLVALLIYLIVGQIRAPGFTDHWGYLVGQTFGILILLVGLEVILARQGGLSWPTHLVALSALYLDVLGTDGNLYANIDEYDKIVHFMGTAAVTACAYELFNGLHRAGSTSRFARDRLLAALSVGALVGIGWEVYEFFGDEIFGSYRVQSRWDTANDIVSDFLGGVAVVTVFLWIERLAQRERAPAHHDTRSS